jgi:hypothetical protein
MDLCLKCEFYVWNEIFFVKKLNNNLGRIKLYEGELLK